MSDNLSMKINIAIDGPAGAGKSTVARLVAGRLGMTYVDTGSMYRAVTWKVLKNGLQPDQISDIVKLTQGLRIELIPASGGQRVWVNGDDVTEKIRTVEVTRSVSQVSQIPEIRAMLVEKQKAMAAKKGVVMDGRDIGTHVLPNAEVKVFLTASVSQRAERRFKEMTEKGFSVTLDELEKEISARDKMDQERKASPLVQAKDAILLDTTELSVDEVVEAIVRLTERKREGEKV